MARLARVVEVSCVSARLRADSSLHFGHFVIFADKNKKIQEHNFFLKIFEQLCFG